MRGLGWHCFEIAWNGEDGAESTGRCYRTGFTCEASRSSWAKDYEVTECSEDRYEYAACLQGRDGSNADEFAICFKRLDSCQSAQSELQADDSIEFVTECVVLE